MRAIALSLLLAGCATMQPGEEAESYRALGTEPFWSITIANGQMRYEAPESGFSVPAPRGQELGDGRLWETRRIRLQASNQECSDGMSDRTYSQAVRAQVDGRTLEGCGGPFREVPSLTGTSWSMLDINGAIVSGAEYVIEFGQDRLSGSAGCNRFAGSYRRDGDRLIVGALAVTRMTCPPPRMEHERQALEVLRGPVTISPGGGGAIMLRANNRAIRIGQAL